jgi:hypothetical protein
MKLNIMILSKMTLSKMTLSIMKLSKMTQQNDSLCVVMLNAIIMSLIVLTIKL